MSKRFIKTLSLIFVILCTLVFIACSSPKNEPSGGGNAGGKESGSASIGITSWYNNNIKYKLSYVSEDECPNGNIADSKLHTPDNFSVGKTYYMVVDFTISSFNESGWNNSFSSSIKISPAAAVSAKLEEAPTSNFTEKTEGYEINITTVYSIPEEKRTAKDYRIVLQFKPIQKDLLNFAFSFIGDSELADRITTTNENFGAGATVGLKYTKNEDAQSYSVAGIGSVTDSHITIPTLYYGLPVTAILDAAFRECSNISDVYMCGNITSIGNKAFYRCGSLTSINIPNSVTYIGDSAFCECSNLQNINMPEGVTHIGSSAFNSCSKLVSIIIPNSVTYIGASAFYECSNLQNINMPEGVTHIGDSAFLYCSSLTSVEIPNSVTSMGVSAFGGCGKLHYNTFDNAKYLGNSENPYLLLAKANSTSITSCSIHPDTKFIDAAFGECGSLTSIIIPNGVTSIGEYAFYYCSSLASIEIPNSVTSIGDCAFWGCNSLQYSVFDNAKYLGNSENPYLLLAKANSTSITSCNIHSDTRFIDTAFGGCTSLTSIVIHSGITSIGNSAFFNCPGLTSIVIPGSVTNIGDSAFVNCPNLTIYCEAESKPNSWTDGWNWNRPVIWGYKG